MSNSPSRNLVDEAVAGFISAAARNMTNATNPFQQQQQQQPVASQMGLNGVPFNVNGLPSMPTNYHQQFVPQPPFQQQQFNTQSQYPNPYNGGWQQQRPPPRSNTAYGNLCRTTGRKPDECNCEAPWLEAFCPARPRA